MNIVLIGGGRFGIALLDQLEKSNHKIIVIDSDKDVVKSISENYDVVAYVGNGASFECLKDDGAKGADLLVAASGVDEVNILACAFAHKLGIKQTVARIKNREYGNQVDFMESELGITALINPDLVTASEIFRTICFPGAIKVESFAKGRVDIAEIKIEHDSMLIGQALANVKKEHPFNALVCAVEREEETIIPSGDFIFSENDYIYICAESRELAKTLKTLKLHKNKQNNVILVGASRISGFLSSLLKDSGFDVRVFEQDKNSAQDFANEHEGITVIRADGTDSNALREEGIENSVFAALTGSDETNIIASTLALKEGSPFVVTKVSNSNLDSLLDTIGLESVVTPKNVFAESVLKYIRTFGVKKPIECKALYHLASDKVEALEFKILAETTYTNIELKDLHFNPGYLIAAIIRKSTVIIPNGSDVILPEDRVIIVTTNKDTNDLGDVFE